LFLKLPIVQKLHLAGIKPRFERVIELRFRQLREFIGDIILLEIITEGFAPAYLSPVTHDTPYSWITREFLHRKSRIERWSAGLSYQTIEDGYFTLGVEMTDA
jgi:hypothetical protein